MDSERTTTDNIGTGGISIIRLVTHITLFVEPGDTIDIAAERCLMCFRQFHNLERVEFEFNDKYCYAVEEGNEDGGKLYRSIQNEDLVIQIFDCGIDSWEKLTSWRSAMGRILG